MLDLGFGYAIHRCRACGGKHSVSCRLCRGSKVSKTVFLGDGSELEVRVPTPSDEVTGAGNKQARTRDPRIFHVIKGGKQ